MFSWMKGAGSVKDALQSCTNRVRGEFRENKDQERDMTRRWLDGLDFTSVDCDCWRILFFKFFGVMHSKHNIFNAISIFLLSYIYKVQPAIPGGQRNRSW